MEHGHGGSGGLEHGTWLHWLYHYRILPDWLPEVVPETFLVVIVLSAIVILARPRLTVRNPGKLQTFLEFCVVSLDSFVRGIVGDEAKSLTPIIGTFFIFILCLNLLGLVPGLTSPTANINTPASLAIVAFCIVQYYGIRKQGFINYLKHFAGEPLILAPLMFPIHVIGELARPLSLTIRLFGNIFGEDMVIAILILIVTSVLGKLLIPLQFPMLIFAIFTSFVQSLVFSMLVTIYVTVAISGHEEHH
ncbi:MAG: F0F1 ATP synthase subunit A [Armatimonadota bacterium]|nr:F0F1 ATP synthase subunit A [Armatimonadota bacterium]